MDRLTSTPRPAAAAPPTGAAIPPRRRFARTRMIACAVLAIVTGVGAVLCVSDPGTRGKAGPLLVVFAFCTLIAWGQVTLWRRPDLAEKARLRREARRAGRGGR